MSRVQLALNVDDIDAAVAFYSELFSAQPAKRRPGYANFAIDDPALKLVLIENPGSGGTLNHLGVEVASTEEVVAATSRLAKGGCLPSWRTAPPAATRCRTRCGPPARAGNAGRSTPCSPTPAPSLRARPSPTWVPSPPPLRPEARPAAQAERPRASSW